MIENPVKLLVVEGYARESRNTLAESGMALASELYRSMLLSIAPNATVDIVTPADGDSHLPHGVELKSYDGVAVTGSNLSVLDADNPSVRRQVELQKEVFDQGVPSFGSCWAMQVGTVAAGGEVRINPKGREMGFARKIRLTERGLNHPLYRGKFPVFDGFASHEDEVVGIPPNSQVLSGNHISSVQALEIICGNGIMWALQYHPEYDTGELASLIRCRQERLIRKGFFSDSDSLLDYTRKLDLLQENPERKDTAWELGIDADILDQGVRQLEARNWIESLVLPNSDH